MRTPDEFTTLDWIGVVLNALLTCALLAFPFAVAPMFASMFDDFCRKDALPAITRVAMKPWPGVGLGLLVAAPTVMASMMRAPESIALRRGLVVVGFFGGALGIALLVYAMYVPIFDLAGSIKA
jgi:hypothetical protein